MLTVLRMSSCISYCHTCVTAGLCCISEIMRPGRKMWMFCFRGCLQHISCNILLPIPFLPHQALTLNACSLQPFKRGSPTFPHYSPIPKTCKPQPQLGVSLKPLHFGNSFFFAKPHPVFERMQEYDKNVLGTYLSGSLYYGT